MSRINSSNLTKVSYLFLFRHTLFILCILCRFHLVPLSNFSPVLSRFTSSNPSVFPLFFALCQPWVSCLYPSSLLLLLLGNWENSCNELQKMLMSWALCIRAASPFASPHLLLTMSALALWSRPLSTALQAVSVSCYPINPCCFSCLVLLLPLCFRLSDWAIPPIHPHSTIRPSLMAKMATVVL